MTWRKFSNKIKKDMHVHQSPVDIDAIWANIEPEVDRINDEKKKKRKFLFFWWLFGLTIIGFLAGLLMTLNNDNNIAESNKTVDSIHSSTSHNASVNTNKVNADVESKVIDINTATNNSTATIEAATNIAETNSNKTSLISTPPNTTNSNTVNSNTAKQTTPKSTTASTSQSVISTTVKEWSAVSNTTGSQIQNTSAQQTLPSQGQAINVQSQQMNSITTSRGQSVITPSKEQTTIIPIQQQPTTLQTTGQPVTSGQPNAIKEKVLEQPAEIQPLPAMPMELIIPPFKPILLTDSIVQFVGSGQQDKNTDQGKKMEFFVTLNGGLGYAFKQLKFPGDSTGGVLDMRSATETMLETSSQGIDIGMMLKNGLELSTGFSRTQVTERFDFNDSVTVNIPVAILDTLFIPLLGDTVQRFSNGYLVQKTIYEKRIFNKYQYYDIPISVGYQKRVHPDWRIGASAGVVINLALKTKGTIMTDIGQFADIATGQADYYKSKIGLNYMGALSISRRLAGNTWLTLTPNVRYSPGRISTTNYTVIHNQPFLVGGKIGLQFRF